MSLLTGPRILETTDAARPLRAGSRWLRTEWILSRALCRYRIVDFAGVPRAKRAAALRLQLSQFAPFPDPGYAVAWEGEAAQVWCWDAARLRDAARGANLSEGRIRVVPETLFVPPLVEGPRLVKLAEGYEGQVWKDRALTRSRYWSALPDAAQWIAFQRDAGVLPGLQQAEPTPFERELLPQPYAKVGEGLASASALPLAEPLLLFVLVALLGTGTAWYAARLAKISAASDRLTAQAKALETSAAPILTARERAIDNDVFANRLARIATYPDQLALIAQFATAFGSDHAVLREWNFSVGKLRAVIAFPNALPPTTGVVASVEGQPDFVNVRIAPANDPKSLVINADVRPRFKNDDAKSAS